MLLNGSTGQESDGHDWYNLLSGWGLLEHDIQIARVMRAVAALGCIAALAVAVWSELRAGREQSDESSTATVLP
jgi:hypothetical protein